MGTGACVTTLKQDANLVSPLVVLADGRLASGGSEVTISVWDVGTCAFVATLEGHTDTVTSLAVLTDGRLARGRYDRTIRMWD